MSFDFLHESLYHNTLYLSIFIYRHSIQNIVNLIHIFDIIYTYITEQYLYGHKLHLSAYYYWAAYLFLFVATKKRHEINHVFIFVSYSVKFRRKPRLSSL